MRINTNYSFCKRNINMTGPLKTIQRQISEEGYIKKHDFEHELNKLPKKKKLFKDKDIIDEAKLDSEDKEVLKEIKKKRYKTFKDGKINILSTLEKIKYYFYNNIIYVAEEKYNGIPAKVARNQFDDIVYVDTGAISRSQTCADMGLKEVKHRPEPEPVYGKMGENGQAEYYVWNPKYMRMDRTYG